MSGPPAEGFGALLRQRRHEAGLTQEELAAAATLSPRSVSDLERGITATARKETARLLADALNLAGPERATFEAAARGRFSVDGFAASGAVTATRTLPRDISSFVGREPEMRQLTQISTNQAQTRGVHTISGMPGVGKTALAVHAAHLLQDRFPDRQLFIDLHAHTPGQDPLSPGTALASLLTAVGVDASYLPQTLEGRAALWRDRIADQRALLVLDNAASTEQIVPLLPGGGSCLVLVTSRRHLGDLCGVAVPMLLEAMPPSQAQMMFLRLAPRATEHVAALELVRLAGNLPLAISLLARVYARHPSWTLSDLTRETSASMLTLAAEKDSVAAAFEVSYRHLTSSRRQFFRRLSLHPGSTVDAYAAAALADVTLREAADHLDALHGECLLTEPSYRRYGMHDLIRHYAQDRAAADPRSDRESALHRLLDYYQQAAATAGLRMDCQSWPRSTMPTPAAPARVLPDLRDHSRALLWGRTEGANLLACLEQVTRNGQHARVVALTAAIANQLRQDGPWAGAIALHNTAVLAACHVGDRQAEASALNDLGDALFLNGDFRSAAEVQDKALGIYRDLGHLKGQASALCELGGLRMLSGEDRGADDLMQALAIYRSLGDRLGQAWTLNWTGYVRRLGTDPASAAEPLAEALIIYRELGHRQGQACTLNQIGVVRRRAGDLSGAARALATSLDIYRELGDPRQGQACVLTDTGVVRREAGDFRGAIESLSEALVIYRELGNRGGEAEALNEMGTLHRICGDAGQAAGCHREALGLSREVGSFLNETQALRGLGLCDHAASPKDDSLS